MALIIGAALAVLSVAVIMYPFLKPRVRTRDHGGVSAVDPAATEVEPVYDAIRTLQLEYQLGKVPENLYLEQLAGYRLQAAGVLRQRAAQRTGYDEWLLEQKVLFGPHRFTSRRRRTTKVSPLRSYGRCKLGGLCRMWRQFRYGGRSTGIESARSCCSGADYMAGVPLALLSSSISRIGRFAAR